MTVRERCIAIRDNIRCPRRLGHSKVQQFTKCCPDHKYVRGWCLFFIDDATRELLAREIGSTTVSKRLHIRCTAFAKDKRQCGRNCAPNETLCAIHLKMQTGTLPAGHKIADLTADQTLQKLLRSTMNRFV